MFALPSLNVITACFPSLIAILCSAFDTEAISEIDVILKLLSFCFCHWCTLQEHLVGASALALLVLIWTLCRHSSYEHHLPSTPFSGPHLLVKVSLLSWHKESELASPFSHRLWHLPCVPMFLPG